MDVMLLDHVVSIISGVVVSAGTVVALAGRWFRKRPAHHRRRRARGVSPAP